MQTPTPDAPALIFTYAEIAAALGIPTWELCSLCKRAGVRLPKWGDGRVFVAAAQLSLLRRALQVVVCINTRGQNDDELPPQYAHHTAP